MTRNELLASLTATNPDRDGMYFDDERYVDWSTDVPSGDPELNGRRVEMGEGQDAVAFDLSWPEIERLHRALTLLLLERDETTEA